MKPPRMTKWRRRWGRWKRCNPGSTFSHVRSLLSIWGMMVVPFIHECEGCTEKGIETQLREDDAPCNEFDVGRVAGIDNHSYNVPADFY
jgi:hypothetical protein